MSSSLVARPATSQVDSARSLDTLSSLHDLFMRDGWKVAVAPKSGNRGQWVTRQILSIADAERTTGRRVDFVMSDAELPSEVLSLLCPEWIDRMSSTTSDCGNQSVTQSFEEVRFPKGDTITLDYTNSGLDADSLEKREVLDVENSGVQIVASLVDVVMIHDRLLATYQVEGTIFA